MVELIRSSGDLVSLSVISPGAIPSSKSAAAGLAQQESAPTPRQYATLPRKLNNNFPTLGMFIQIINCFIKNLIEYF